MSVYSKLFGEYYGLADSLVENIVKVKFTSKEGSKEINFTWHEDFCGIPPQDIQAAAGKQLLLAYSVDRKGVRNIRLSDIIDWQVIKSAD